MEEGVDRINELTDSMLVSNTMSRLDCTTNELIRTTATISKRWKYLWTHLPHLVFSYFGYDDTNLSFIDNALNRCPANLNLKRLKLHINYLFTNYNGVVNYEFKSLANRWIRYAISHNVEDVDLWLPYVGLGQDFTFEDELFFKTSCITRMTLSYCRFNPPNGVISWERLACLCLYSVTLDEDMIEKILFGSLCLESLELNDCYGYRRIDITSKNVKKLVFSGYNSDHEINVYENAYIDCVKIDAPYISSLTIKAELVLRDFVLLNVSSLVETHLDYSMDSWIFHNENVPRALLESLGHVEDITFGYHCSKLLSRLEAVSDTSNDD